MGQRQGNEASHCEDEWVNPFIKHFTKTPN